MKILAKRSDTIFYVGAVVIPVCILIMVNSDNLYEYFSSIGYHERRLVSAIIIMTVLVFAVCLYSFFQRLTIPRVIIEYDESNIYIHKTKNEPTIVLCFSEIKGARSDEVASESEVEGVVTTASALRIQTVDSIITIYGIENCTDVKLKLNRLVREYTKQRVDYYCRNIEGKQDFYTDKQEKY